MKIYGSIKELVSAVYRKNSQQITVRPNQSTTYTADRDVQLPPQDADAVLVSQSATQTLTNKTITSPLGIVKGDVGLGNVDNTSDATKNSASATLTNKTLTDAIIDDGVRLNHETSVTTPASGKVSLFAKNDDKLYLTNSSGVTSPVAASGTGEKNYITNPSGASSTTGWANVGDLDIARTTTAGDLPREFSTATGLKITADSNTQSTADYVYFDFTLDDVDLSKKLKIEWSQKQTGSYAASDLAVIITTQADRTTALHTPVTTNIPAVDGVFTTSFDSSTTATLSLVIRATTDMATDAGIVISDIVVGPGIITQGAVVSEWQSYTPTLNTGAFGSGTTVNVNYRRVGSAMELLFQVVQSNAGTAGSGTYSFNMPTGTTIDTAKLSGTNILGKGYITSGAIEYANALGYATSTTRYAFYINPTATTVANVGSAQTPLSTANFQISMLLQIPIAEWAGNGTVNLGPGAQVEYASNTGAEGVAAATTYSNSAYFAYGPAGSQFAAVASTTLDQTTNYRVQFQTPIQASDKIEIEVSEDSGVSWNTQPSIVILNRQIQNTAIYGMFLIPVSSTQINVSFANYGRLSTGGTFAAAGAAWSGIAGSSTYKWRVKKCTASAPVGFGLAGTDGSSGLYKAGQAPATTAGAAIASGYIGYQERSYTSGVSITNGATTTIASITLTAGVWAISAVARADGVASLARWQATISSVTNFYMSIGSGAGDADFDMVASGTLLNATGCIPCIVVTPTASTTYYLVGSPQGATVNARGRISAIRIA